MLNEQEVRAINTAAIVEEMDKFFNAYVFTIIEVKSGGGGVKRIEYNAMREKILSLQGATFPINYSAIFREMRDFLLRWNNSSDEDRERKEDLINTVKKITNLINKKFERKVKNIMEPDNKHVNEAIEMRARVEIALGMLKGIQGLLALQYRDEAEALARVGAWMLRTSLEM